jgi:predicted PurR-regulated permease PerM
MKNQESKIKRLEIAVISLSILFVLSIFVSMYGFYQIKSLSDKIPSYKEIKEDIKFIKNNYPRTKEKIVAGYEYTKEKTSAAKEVVNDKVSDAKKSLIKYLEK